MAAKVLHCNNNCSHAFQDKEYGHGYRVFNKTAKKDPQYWRCTVCAGTQSYGESETTGKKEKASKKK